MLWMQLVMFHIESKCLRPLINFTFRLCHLICAIKVFWAYTNVNKKCLRKSHYLLFSIVGRLLGRKKVKDTGGDNQNDIYCVLTLNPQILATRSINEHVPLVILSQQTKAQANSVDSIALHTIYFNNVPNS